MDQFEMNIVKIEGKLLSIMREWTLLIFMVKGQGHTGQNKYGNNLENMIERRNLITECIFIY